jgi:hypothetical protein
MGRYKKKRNVKMLLEVFPPCNGNENRHTLAGVLGYY